MATTPGGIGPLLREWREARRLSQLALAGAAGVSTRHLSCVETGRSRPSPELVLHLAEHLEVPLRARNQLLLAAGYAPVFAERPLDDPGMAPVASVLDSVLERSEPNPTVIVDRCWNLLRANAPALWLCTDVDPELLEPPANVARLSVAPTIAPTFAIPLRIEVEGHPLALFSTIATFGTAVDVGLSEMSIETFYPADDATADVLRTRPWRRPHGPGPAVGDRVGVSWADLGNTPPD